MQITLPISEADQHLRPEAKEIKSEASAAPDMGRVKVLCGLRPLAWAGHMRLVVERKAVLPYNPRFKTESHGLRGTDSYHLFRIPENAGFSFPSVYTP